MKLKDGQPQMTGLKFESFLAIFFPFMLVGFI